MLRLALVSLSSPSVCGLRTKFHAGNKQCIGKNLAMTEIRLVTARLMKNFEVSFIKGYDPEVFERDMRDQVTCQPGELWLEFAVRDAAVA